MVKAKMRPHPERKNPGHPLPENSRDQSNKTFLCQPQVLDQTNMFDTETPFEPKYNWWQEWLKLSFLGGGGIDGIKDAVEK